MSIKIAISVGDINGVGLELILKNHDVVSQLCQPIYCVNDHVLQQAACLLNTTIPENFFLHETKGKPTIKPAKISKSSGLYSYNSFIDAVKLTKKDKANAVVTLPIHKKAWEKANIHYVGHTDALRDIFNKNAIMMLGCEELFVALYTEHIPLRKVAKKINEKDLLEFFIDFYKSTKATNVGVLGLNPHAGDNGVLGDEEVIIARAIFQANKKLDKKIFKGPIVPDIAFTPHIRKQYKYMIAMYHDQGLAPLKALYFDESINVSLNLPIIRTSVDHGTAFDIAYQNSDQLNSQSYINAIKEAVYLATC